MSYSDQILKTINEHVDLFLTDLSAHTNIDKKELLNIWNKKSTPKRSKVKPAEEKPAQVGPYENASDVMVASKDILIAMCKKHGLKHTGKKDLLINRLLNKDEDTPTPAPKKKSPKRSKRDDSKVVKKIKDSATEICFKRNKWGNLWHEETGLVADKVSKCIIFKQDKDGNESNLTPEDIDICNMYKLPYELPENLDESKSGLDHVHVDELDSDGELNEELELEIEDSDDEYEEVEEIEEIVEED